MSPLDLTLNEYLVFMLVLLRMSGMVVFAPFLGSKNIPRRSQIGLVLFLSLLIFSSAADSINKPLELSFNSLVLLGLREVLVGLVLGYAAGLVFSGVQLAGELVGQQIGFTLANVIDPLSEEEVGLISFFKFTLAIIVFVSFNLHLVFIEVMVLSYQVVGIGEARLGIELLGKLCSMFGQIWEVALQVGGPMLMIMLLVSVVIGFLTRTMPQLNIIVIGLPSRTLIGLLALTMVIEPFVLVIKELSLQMLDDIGIILQLFKSAQVAA